MEVTTTTAGHAVDGRAPAIELLGGVLRNLLRIPVGERRLRKRYAAFFKRSYGSAPELFTEKLFKRMIVLNRRQDPLMTRLADKFRARDWVADRIGEHHLPRLFWHGAAAAALPFRQLPDRCVIKTNHGSGQVIVKDGLLDEVSVKTRLSAWLGENYYWRMQERQYLEIEPHILVEEFLEGGDDGPLDYRFWCFDGHVAAIQVDNHSHSICPFYDVAWRRLDLRYRDGAKHVEIDRPAELEQMLEIAAKLSRGLAFVRVDLYNIAGRILFGEMTFTPAAGQMHLPRAWDERLGALWK